MRVEQLLRDAEREHERKRCARLARREPGAGRQRERQRRVLQSIRAQQPGLPGAGVGGGERGLARSPAIRDSGVRRDGRSGARVREGGEPRGEQEAGEHVNGWWKSPDEAAAARARLRLCAHEWPPALRSALARLQDGGRRAYAVGGTVRDVLVGRAGREPWDVACERTPDEVRDRFPRLEPIGEKHGTLLLLWEGARIECTTFRREGAYGDARRPDQVWFTEDPLEDLARRDFTVNAIAFDPLSGELLDPQGGTRDLERRRLRAVGVPEERFREDALRVFRFARLAAQLELAPDEDTLGALATARERVPGLAAERVRAELEGLLAAPRPSDGLELLREAGLLEPWLHELQVCRGVPQNRFHAYDVYFHSLYSCDAVPADKPVVRWAALLHDLGKPDTREMRDGDATFYNHAAVGASLADRLLERLRFPNAFRERVVHLVREHMFEFRDEWSDAAIRRWLRRVGVDAVADLFDLRIADALGNGLRQGFPAGLDAMRRRIDRVLAERDALAVRDLAIDGADVMRALGVGPGPVVGEALAALLEGVLEHPEWNARETLLERLAAWRRERDATTRTA